MHKNIYDWVAMMNYWELHKLLGFDHAGQWCMYKREAVQENTMQNSMRIRNSNSLLNPGQGILSNHCKQKRETSQRCCCSSRWVKIEEKWKTWKLNELHERTGKKLVEY